MFKVIRRVFNLAFKHKHLMKVVQFDSDPTTTNVYHWNFIADSG
jgi:hypothetical protein